MMSAQPVLITAAQWLVLLAWALGPILKAKSRQGLLDE